MNHELAKDLKEAGFPQAGDGATYVDLGARIASMFPPWKNSWKHAWNW